MCLSIESWAFRKMYQFECVKCDKIVYDENCIVPEAQTS